MRFSAEALVGYENYFPQVSTCTFGHVVVEHSTLGLARFIVRAGKD